MDEFTKKYTVYERTQQATKLLEKYHDRVPVLIKSGNKNTPEVDKFKYLVPSSLTVGEFIYIIRKRIKIKPEQAMFIFVNGVLPPVSSTVGAVYQEHHNQDSFLYMVYSLENTFG